MIREKCCSSGFPLPSNWMATGANILRKDSTGWLWIRQDSHLAWEIGMNIIQDMGDQIYRRNKILHTPASRFQEWAFSVKSLCMNDKWIANKFLWFIKPYFSFFLMMNSVHLKKESFERFIMLSWEAYVYCMYANTPPQPPPPQRKCVFIPF